MIKNLKLQDQPGIAQKVSRRVSYLKEQAITGYRVFLNWTSFDLYQTVIIHGHCSKLLARKLRNYIYNSNGSQTQDGRPSFPFQGVFLITETGFLWYVRAPPAHISDLANFVMEICPKHDMFWVGYKHSLSYFLWDETFDEEKRQWKSDRTFMVDDVLARLE